VTALQTTSPPPGAFYSNGVVWMADRRQLLAFGGLTVRNNVSAADCPQQAAPLHPGPSQCAIFSNDTYVLDLASLTWTRYPASLAGVPMQQPGPPSMHSPDQPLSFHSMVAMAYDARRGGAWLIGGKYAISYSSSDVLCPDAQYALFFFSLAAGVWRQVDTMGPGPCAVVDHSLASLPTLFVNPVRDELVVYSGVDSAFVVPSLACTVLSLGVTPPQWRVDVNCGPVTDGSRNAPSYLPAAWMDTRPGREGAMYVMGGLFPG